MEKQKNKMQKIYGVLGLLLIMSLVSPQTGYAANVKTFTGNVTKITGSQLVFTNNSAAIYSADIANATLQRKNGSSMSFAEFTVGDKIEVKGTLWNDNSISSVSIRDMSLYAHNSSFTGKITAISPVDSSFTLQSKTYGTQTIITNNFTSFTKNGKSATFKDLDLGLTTSVKGSWDRSYATVVASQVQTTFKLINIYFTGTLSILNNNSFTVIGNGNVIYGVDTNSATVQSKNGKTITLGQVKLNDTLRVWGKHIAGSVKIAATKIIDSSLTN